MRHNLLRIIREGRGWTQDDLGQRAGLPASTVGAIERGDIDDPGFQTVMALCMALDLDPHLLLDLKPRSGVSPEVVEALAWDMATRALKHARQELREAAW